MAPEPGFKLLPPLSSLGILATDLRWSWHHAGDQLWQTINPELWQQTKNPYAILQMTSIQRWEQLATDTQFLKEIQVLVKERETYLGREGWYQVEYGESSLQKVAYFSMEFGVSDVLPFYAGGLGLLAGDCLKAASDLKVPMVGVGLFYHQGNFIQLLDNQGWQQELHPSCEPDSLPLMPVIDSSGEPVLITLSLPGRDIKVRAWQAVLGSVTLYLLDSCHPQNAAIDCAITSQLYPASQEARLLQQWILGIGGWLLLEALKLPIDICHLNESHCAFVVLGRAWGYMRAHQVSFAEAMVVTRAGNLFTTHTSVLSAFDHYDASLLEKYLSVYAVAMDIPIRMLMNTGKQPGDPGEKTFSPLYLALHGCGAVNAVSRVHAQVMRRFFQSCYPRWPEREVPVSFITNGIYVPGWDSPWADQFWTEAAGKGRWVGELRSLMEAITRQSDDQLWRFRCQERADLVNYVRQRLLAEFVRQGAAEKYIQAAKYVLDPNILTIGLARRFTSYKRLNLLLTDPLRLQAMLNNRDMPVQIVVAGKAHPLDIVGKEMIQQWARFTRIPEVNEHAIFLTGYDIALAQEMVQGVDVWINMPRYPWEACGTSGMKVLVNGGLNISVLDGWWAEAFRPELGWAFGETNETKETASDAQTAEQLYQCLENEVIPAFYQRDTSGLPRQWIARMRASMAELAPYYSSNRMVRQYTEKLYIELAKRFHQRANNGADAGRSILRWQQVIANHWAEIHWGQRQIVDTDTGFNIDVQVYLGGVPVDCVQVQLYADGESGKEAECIAMEQQSPIVGTIGGYQYHAGVQTQRPAHHYTPRIIARHQLASIPGECANILWWGE